MTLVVKIQEKIARKSGVQIQGDGVYSSPKDFDPSPKINICFYPPNKNMSPFTKNRLTYTHVTQH